MKPNRDRNDRNNQEEKSPYTEKVVAIDRVARVVKGGRRFRFRALVVVGDQKGQVGVGIAKGADVTAAVAKATEVAKKDLKTIPIIDGTIPHEAYAKVGGSKIMIKPAAPGTGLIAGGVVRTVLEAVGVRNALSKSLGSSNKVNTSYATIEALLSLEARENWITTKNQKKTSPKPVSKPEKATTDTKKAKVAEVVK